MKFNQLSSGENVGSSHLLFDQQNQNGTTVNVVTLDSMFPEKNNINFMKIDAEGAECGIFMGAQNILKNKHLTVVMEWMKTMQESSGVDVKACVHNLEQVFGFKMYKVTRFFTLKKINSAYLLENNGMYDVVLTKDPNIWIDILCFLDLSVPGLA